MITFVAFVLICIAVILLGATQGKPLGWVVLGLAVLALLLYVLGGLPLFTPAHR